MFFIYLTASTTKLQVAVNMELVTTINPSNSGGSVLDFAAGDSENDQYCIQVEESPHDIMKILPNPYDK